VNAAYRLTNIFLKAWNKKMSIGGIFYDLDKAFDCVNNEISLSKLHHSGVQSLSINCLRSYLFNRKKRVELKMQSAVIYYSICETVKHGVPQG